MRSFLAFAASLALVAACSSREDRTPAPGDGGTDAGLRIDGGGIDSGPGVDGGPGTDAGRDAGAGTDAGPGLDAGGNTDAGGRTVVEGGCARAFGSCTSDIDCSPQGCGAETCASEEISTTCDCVAPAATCGCVAGSCAWYL